MECLRWGRQGKCQQLSWHGRGLAATLCAGQWRCVRGTRSSSGLAGNRLCRFGSFGAYEPFVEGGRSTPGLAVPLRCCIDAARSGEGEEGGDVIALELLQKSGTPLLLMALFLWRRLNDRLCLQRSPLGPCVAFSEPAFHHASAAP